MKEKRPNIVFIMADDHAAHALSCYGSRINTTPNMDRIANEGAIFKNCFCTNSICEPSRAAMLTGTYNHVNKVTTIGSHLDNSLPNVAKELQANGYQTAIFGKWHLGQGEKHYPSGFDKYKILQGQGTYFDPEMVCNGEKVQFTGYTTDIITDLTLDYIQKRDKTRPFFVQFHHKAPHRNWVPDEKHRTMYEDIDIPLPDNIDDDYSNRSQAAIDAKMRITVDMEYRDLKLIPPDGVEIKARIPHPTELRDFFLVPKETGKKIFFKDQAELLNFKYQRYIKDYLRCIASIDDNIGRLFDQLEAEGILDDTIIIYTSDQGFFLGDHGWYDKRFMYEESLRMPLIIRYPKGIKPGTVIDEIVTNVDIPASFTDWAVIDKPEYFQGNSFLPLLAGEIPDDWQQAMYYRYWMHLHFHYVPAHYGIRTKKYKLIYFYGEALGQIGAIDEPKQPEWELFDLVKDPREMNNVYHHPDYRTVVKQLKDELHALQKKVGDTPQKEIG